MIGWIVFLIVAGACFGLIIAAEVNTTIQKRKVVEAYYRARRSGTDVQPPYFLFGETPVEEDDEDDEEEESK